MLTPPVIDRLVTEQRGWLQQTGWRPDGRTLWILPGGDPRYTAQLIALVLAAFEEGIPVALPEGVIRGATLRAAIRACPPVAIVAPSRMRIARWWMPALWRTPWIATETLASRAAGCGAAPLDESRHNRPDGIALRSLSSGSGGALRIVDRTHRVLAAQHAALESIAPYAPDDREATAFPAIALHAVASGGTVGLIPSAWRRVVRDRHARPADVAAVRTWLQATAPTRLSCAPALLRALLEDRAGGPLIEECRSSLRLVACGGGPISQALARRVCDALPDTNAIAVYGSSEAEPIATASFHDIADRSDRAGYIIGRPTGPTKSTIVGGDLFVRGETVASDSPAEWVPIGDRVVRDEDGMLRLLGRRSDQLHDANGTWHDSIPLERHLAAELTVDEVAIVAAQSRLCGRRHLLVAVNTVSSLDKRAAIPRIRKALTDAGFAIGALPLRLTGGPLPRDRRHHSKVDKHRIATAAGYQREIAMPTTAHPPSPAADFTRDVDLTELRYGQSWEDPALFAEALQWKAGSDTLMIGSAGDRVFDAILAGARSVAVIDVSDAQHALWRLKTAAVDALDAEELAPFAGFLVHGDDARRMTPSERADRYRKQVRPRLPHTDQRLWDDRIDRIADGIARNGRLDRFFEAFRTTIVWALPDQVQRRLTALDLSLEEQRELAEQWFATGPFADRFREMFGRSTMSRDARSDAQFHFVDESAESVAAMNHRRLLAALRSAPIRQQPFLWQFLFGTWPTLADAPAWVQPKHTDRLRSIGWDRVSQHTTRIESFAMDGPPGRFDAVHLSDVPEYGSAADHAERMRALAHATRPGGRVLWWELYVPRPLPTSEATLWRDELAVSAACTARDRVWFYGGVRVASRTEEASNR